MARAIGVLPARPAWRRRVAAALAAGTLGACGGDGAGPAPAWRLDPAFGQAGIAVVPPAGSLASAHARSLSFDESGRLLLAGSAAPAPADPPVQAVFSRLLASGAADPAFADAGSWVDSASPTLGEGRRAFAVAGGGVQVVENQVTPCAIPPGPDCSVAHSQVFVRRLRSDGSVDGAWGTTSTGPMREIDSLPGPGGSLAFLASLTQASNGNNLTLRRLDSTGRPEGAFTGNADAALACPGLAYGAPHDGRLAGLADGRYLVVRTDAGAGPATHRCVVRLSPDGMLDATFGAGGRLTLDDPVLDGAAVVAIVALDDGGAVIVLGREAAGGPAQVFLAWLTAAGTMDLTRGTAGITGPLASLGRAAAAAAQADGGIVLAGWPGLGNSIDPTRPRVVRVDARGQPDASFGEAAGGGVSLATGAWRLQPAAVAARADGSVFVAGDAEPVAGGPSSAMAVAKLAAAPR